MIDMRRITCSEVSLNCTLRSVHCLPARGVHAYRPEDFLHCFRVFHSTCAHNSAPMNSCSLTRDRGALFTLSALGPINHIDCDAMIRSWDCRAPRITAGDDSSDTTNVLHVRACVHMHENKLEYMLSHDPAKRSMPTTCSVEWNKKELSNVRRRNVGVVQAIVVAQVPV